MGQHRIDLTFLNANENVQIEGKTELASHSTFQSLDKENSIRAQHFNEVLYKSIYDHIDLRYFFTAEKSIKYEFIVHPGGDVNDIQIAYKGQEKTLELDSSGALIVSSKFGSILEAAPYSFLLNKNIVESSYKLSENVLSFNVAGYDKTKTLVIDPYIAWSTFHGGGLNDFGTSITHDEKNYLYMCGGTSSFNFPTSTGAHQDTLTAKMDAFVSKFDSSGALVWSTYFGGLEEDLGVDIVSSPNGTLYLVANTTSQLKTSNGSIQGSLKGNSDAFIMKLNSNGELQWSTYYGGDSVDVATGISIDSKERVFVSGYTLSKNLLVSPSAFQKSLKGDSDGFVLNIDSSGTLRWATYLGGSGAEELLGICNDHRDNVYVTGFSTSSDFKTTTLAHQDSISGKLDVVVACFDTLGALRWASYFGGAENDIGTAIVADDHRNVYVTGSTASKQLEIKGQDTAQVSFAGGTEDAFVISFERNGILDFATYYGGGNSDKAVAIDWYHKAVAIAGYTNSSDLYIGPRSIQYNKKAGFDGFTLNLDTNGKFLRATYLGGAGADYLTDIKFYFGGQALTGYSLSNDYHISSGARQTLKDGGSDAILTTLCPALFRYILGGYCHEKGYVTTITADRFKANYPISFQWQIKTLFDWKDIPGATESFLHRDTIKQVTYYRRIYTGGMCTDTTITTRFRIGPVPNAAFLDTGGHCRGDTTYFLNRSTVTSGGLTYKWFFGPGQFSSLTDPKYVFSKVDTAYAVRLKAISDSNCTSKQWAYVSLRSAPIANFKATNDCDSDSTLFKSTSTSKYPYSVNWKLENGDTSARRKFLYLYPTLGTYQVTLVASNGYNCRDTLTKTIEVDSNLKAGFKIKNACPEDTVEFNNLSVPRNGIVAIKWILGDGDTSWTYHSNHAYLDTGKYATKLVAFDKHGCTDTVNRLIQIIEPPKILATALTSCQTDSTLFNATVTGADSFFTFTWDLGDGTEIKNLTDFSYVYKNYALHKVLFTAQSSSLHCKRSQELEVFHDSLLQADFTMEGECEGALTRFNNTTQQSSGTITWFWNFGDFAKSKIESPVHPYQSGSYTVSLRAVSDSGCTDSISKNITIHPSPKVSFKRDTACFGDSVNFRNTTISTDDISTWKWNFGDQNKDSTEHTTHTYSRGGTFQARLTATTVNGCTESVIKNVIQPFPLVAILDERKPVSCYGLKDGSLTVRGGGGLSPISINWPNLNPPSSQPTISNLGAGTYTVALKDAMGCTLNQDFDIEEPDSLQIAEMPDITICENGTANLVARPLGGTAPFTFTWSCNKPNCSFLSIQNERAQVKPMYNKEFTAVAVDSRGCKSAPQTVNVITLPVLKVDAGPRLYALEGRPFRVHAECDTTCNYSWSPSSFFDNHLQQTPLATLSSTTILKVTASAEGTCPASDQVEIIVLKELNFANSFTPNKDGVNDTWEIRNLEFFEDTEVTVYNRWGAAVFESKNASKTWDGTNNGRLVPSGAYYYVIDLKDGSEALTGSVTVLE